MLDDKTIVTASVTILVTFSGFIIKYLNDIELAKRKDRLDRINKQLGDFYGPLYSLLKSNNQSWKSFREKYKPNGAYFNDPNFPTTQTQIEEWKHYMKYVFMPHNDKIHDILISKSDLLIEDKMPECLLKLISHIVIYKAILKKWELGDDSELISIINFPLEVNEYIYTSFEFLKKEQFKIISKNKPLLKD
ncbi:hypothetical protein [Flavobacterium sp. B17]|uniref:hypothetical protein n=1 Tax=Flavobacterium sp. B17 TaxID=95618 RepID=UPI00034D807B|nr:hypothetical protein [Flavobacterium sp. B17]